TDPAGARTSAARRDNCRDAGRWSAACRRIRVAGPCIGAAGRRSWKTPEHENRRAGGGAEKRRQVRPAIARGAFSRSWAALLSAERLRRQAAFPAGRGFLAAERGAHFSERDRAGQEQQQEIADAAAQDAGQDRDL